jgi:hypothetical protein
MGWFKVALALIAPLAALVASCGGDSSSNSFDDAGGNDSAVASGGGGGSGGSGGSAASGGAGGNGVPDSGSSGTTGGPVDACASTSYAAEPMPLDMFILLDQSGSMNTGPPAPWLSVTDAIRAFVQSPDSAGIGVGIQYFPLGAQQVQCISNNNPPGCVCIDVGGMPLCFNNNTASCVVEDYAMPDVAFEPLPGVAQAIIDSLAAHSPSGGTPTLPALEGAMRYAISHAALNPARKTIVVLATDGAPNDCNSDVTNVSQVAAAGLADAPAIQTFVIGIGDVANLDAIAQAGGTGQALVVNTATANQDFLNAMKAIAGQPSIGCSLTFPTPPDGGVIDPAQVELTFAPPSGPAQVIGRVATASDCDPIRGGWYYPSQPTHIELCPATCDLLATSGMSLTFAIGCR